MSTIEKALDKMGNLQASTVVQPTESVTTVTETPPESAASVPVATTAADQPMVNQAVLAEPAAAACSASLRLAQLQLRAIAIMLKLTYRVSVNAILWRSRLSGG